MFSEFVIGIITVIVYYMNFFIAAAFTVVASDSYAVDSRKVRVAKFTQHLPHLFFSHAIRRTYARYIAVLIKADAYTLVRLVHQIP